MRPYFHFVSCVFFSLYWENIITLRAAEFMERAVLLSLVNFYFFTLICLYASIYIWVTKLYKRDSILLQTARPHPYRTPNPIWFTKTNTKLVGWNLLRTPNLTRSTKTNIKLVEWNLLQGKKTVQRPDYKSPRTVVVLFSRGCRLELPCISPLADRSSIQAVEEDGTDGAV